MNQLNFFSYSLFNETSLDVNNRVNNIIKKVLNKWESVIVSAPYEHSIYVEVFIKYINIPGRLGSAGPSTATSFNFGDMFTINANVILNANEIFQYTDDFIYNVILHEFGHALGIGIYWYYNNSPIKEFLESDGIKRKYYLGENALREYRNIFNNQNLIGIPVEDDGGEGTKDGHSEEGQRFDNGIEISRDNRIVNGIFHPGLKEELMTGWADETSPLSRITIGFINDIGYEVDYSKADYYNPSNILSDDNVWYFPDYRNYLVDDFKEKIGLTEEFNSKIKILIIDAGFDNGMILKNGDKFNSENYKNFTNYQTGNDKIHGTHVYLTIKKFAPNADYYFAESEWAPTETISELNNLVKALEWAKEIKPDIINISLGYIFDSYKMIEYKNQIEEIINTLDSVVICATDNTFKIPLTLPSEIKEIFSVGNTQRSHNYKENIKPDFVVPNIYNAVSANYWNSIPHTSKCSAVVTGLFHNFISQRPFMTKKEIKEYVIKSSSNLTRDLIYGYGVPSFTKFNEITNNFETKSCSISLKKGWNLISICLDRSVIDNLLNYQQILEIKNINSSYNSKISKIFNTLNELEITSSYWINCNESVEINLEGINIDSVEFNIKKGWNMISCPFNGKILLSSFLNENILEIKSVTESYNSELPMFSTLKSLEPTKGYYLKSNNNFILKLNNLKV